MSKAKKTIIMLKLEIEQLNKKNRENAKALLELTGDYMKYGVMKYEDWIMGFEEVEKK